MPKKPNDVKSYLPTESGGAGSAPAARKKVVRAKAAVAAQGGGQTKVTETTVEEPRAASVVRTETTAALTSADRDEIARIAYTLWEQRGGQGGSSEDDWHRAEQEFRKKRETTPR
jgi:hypothetical protein